MLASVGADPHSRMWPFVDFKSRLEGNVLLVVDIMFCTVCSVPTACTSCYIQKIFVVLYQATVVEKVVHFASKRVLISSLASWQTVQDGPLKGTLKPGSDRLLRENMGGHQ